MLGDGKAKEVKEKTTITTKLQPFSCVKKPLQNSKGLEMVMQIS